MDEPTPANAESFARAAFESINGPDSDVNRNYDGDDEDTARVSGFEAAESSGFEAAGQKKDDEEDEDQPHPHITPFVPGAGFEAATESDQGRRLPNLRGEGWIWCGWDKRGRGTWICDKGDEILVPFSRSRGMSDGQKAKIYELAQQKGWQKTIAFQNNGRKVHEAAGMQLLMAGLSCCTNQKVADQFFGNLKECKAAYRERVLPA